MSRTAPAKKRYWPTACVCRGPHVPLSYNVETDGSQKRNKNSTLNVGGRGGVLVGVGHGVFKMLLREIDTFFVGGCCPKNHPSAILKPRKPIGMKSLWSVRCTTLSARASFVQAFRFAGGNSSALHSVAHRMHVGSGMSIRARGLKGAQRFDSLCRNVQ